MEDNNMKHAIPIILALIPLEAVLGACIVVP
jgi:hypothetical protein